MNTIHKTNSELLNELAELKLENQSLKSQYEREITELRLKEDVLERERIEYQTIIDSAPVMIAYKSKDDHFINVNSAFAEFIGMPKEKIIGKTTFDIVKQHDVALQGRNHDIEVMRTGEPVLNKLIKWSGFISEKEIWALYSKMPFHDGDGNVIGTVSFVIDVDDRTHAEKALKESRRTIQSIINSTTDAIYVKDVQGKYLLFNAAAERVAGKLSADVIGKDDYSLFVPHEAKVVMDNDRKVMQSRNIITYEETVTDTKGILSTFLSTKGPLYNENGKLIGLFGIARDITERKQAEYKLQENEDRYRDLVENSNDLICTHDLDGNLLSMNNAAQNITGYSKDEALKMNMKNILAPEYRRFFNAYLEKIKAIGHAQGLMIIQTKTGERRIWEYNNTLRKNGVANPVVRGMVKDITELKKSEAALKKLNSELIISNTEKDKLLSIIAHDLKSPFHGFLGLTQLMATEPNSYSADELSQIGKDMYQSANNLFILLKNLFDWAQMQKGSTDFHLEIFSLSELISANLELVNQRSRQKGITMINLTPNQVNVHADKNMINSILSNLLWNAVKFTNRNGTVSINAIMNDDEMIEISVKDSGIGIHKNMLDKIFKVGEITGRKGTDGELSTGLGLLLCKEFVEKNGGKIWVESKEGIGSTFYFTLQCSRSHFP